MKKIIAATLISLAVAGIVQGASIRLDKAFSRTQAWLDENNLSLTGGSNGTRDDRAAFGQEAIIFYGEAAGNPAHHTPAQREQMAKRAAVVMAQRALVEYLEGFSLAGDVQVKDGAATRSTVTGFVKGSQVVFQEYDSGTDTAIALVRFGLHGPEGFASALYRKILSDPGVREGIQTDRPAFKQQPVRLDDAYDGLIIDASGQNFRPALINRIFAGKGDVLYDPATISQKVLVEQGCGEYTNSTNKARAALSVRGVRNPLLVKASGSPRPADLQVTDADALLIYSADQKGNFLAAAKVAFVLK